MRAWRRWACEAERRLAMACGTAGRRECRCCHRRIRVDRHRSERGRARPSGVRRGLSVRRRLDLRAHQDGLALRRVPAPRRRLVARLSFGGHQPVHDHARADVRRLPTAPHGRQRAHFRRPSPHAIPVRVRVRARRVAGDRERGRRPPRVPAEGRLRHLRRLLRIRDGEPPPADAIRVSGAELHPARRDRGGMGQLSTGWTRPTSI